MVPHMIMNSSSSSYQKNLNVNLNTQEKIQKNILLFQNQLKNNLIIVKQLHTNESLLVALDLCQPHYQNWLNIY